MSRIFNRPMFKRGGSAGQGITSGLDRPRKRYALGSIDWDEVTAGRDKLKESYGRPPGGYGVYDFLTDWGLRMASATPKGNVLQTAASEAIEPHEKLMAGKSEAEMAEYLAGIKATDLSISSLTDIAAAEAKNTLNKDFSVKRRVDTLSTQIRDKATPGTFGSTIQGSMGLALGQVYVTDLIQEQGANVNVGIIANENEEGDFSFDAANLDMEKVWWDPKKQSWLVVTESVNDDGETVAKKNYYTTFDEANKFHTQKKTIDSIDEESVVGGKKKEKAVSWETEVEQEKFKDVTKYTEEYLREKFKTYIQGLRNKQSIASQAGTGVQIMPDLSAEDTVFWRNYQNDPERAYQRWKNKITSFGKKQKEQMDIAETLEADIDYGLEESQIAKKAKGGRIGAAEGYSPLGVTIPEPDKDVTELEELNAWWKNQLKSKDITDEG